MRPCVPRDCKTVVRQSEPLGHIPHGLQTLLLNSPILQSLTLSDCQLSSLSLPPLPLLTTLSLPYNYLQGCHLLPLSQLKSLKFLNLAYNRIGSVSSLTAMKGMGIEVVWLEGNPLEKEAGVVVRVGRLWPGVRVGGQLVEGAVMGQPVYYQQAGPQPTRWPIRSSLQLQYQLQQQHKSQHQPKPILPPTPKKRPPRNPSKKGTTLPLSKLKKVMQSLLPDSRIKTKAMVFLGAVIQSLSKEMLQLAGNLALEQMQFKIRKGVLLRVMRRMRML